MTETTGTQVKVKTSKTEILLQFGVVFLLLFLPSSCYLVWLFRDALEQMVYIIGYLLIVLVAGFVVYGLGRGAIWVLASLVVVGNGYADLVHKWRMQRLAEHNAALIHVDHKNSLIDGPARKVIIEARPIGYLQANTAQSETVQPETLPRLLDVMRNRKTPLVIKGIQQYGKTNVAAAIASNWNLPTVFIAVRNETKYHFNGCRVYAEETRKGSISRGISAAMDTLHDYDPACVLLDDMTNYKNRVNPDDLEALILEVGTQAMTHNVRFVITIHALNKDAFGLSSVASEIKDSFALLVIDEPETDNNLNVISVAETGRLYNPGTWSWNNLKGGDPVRLPGPVSFAPVDPEQEFRTNAALWLAGKKTKTELCEATFGSKGANWPRLDDKLRANGLPTERE